MASETPPLSPNEGGAARYDAALAAEHRPRLYITNGPVHNPTGVTVSAQTVHRVLKRAEAHDFVIVEDDVFADFEEEPAPRRAAFDGLDRVIRVSGFSKSLSGGARLGYLAARQDWIAAITDLRIATGLWGSPLSAELVRMALSDGSYRPHVERVPGSARACPARGVPPSPGTRNRAMDRAGGRPVPVVPATGRDRHGGDRPARRRRSAIVPGRRSAPELLTIRTGRCRSVPTAVHQA